MRISVIVSLLMTVLFVDNICWAQFPTSPPPGGTTGIAGMPGIPPLPVPPGPTPIMFTPGTVGPTPTPMPPRWLQNQQGLVLNSTFSEGNTLAFTAYGKYATMYGHSMYQSALWENGNQQSRRIAHEAHLAEIAARPRPPQVIVRNHYYGTACGSRHCGCNRLVPVYRSWCSLRRSYRYRSCCAATGAVTYDAYVPPSGIRWNSGFGPI